MNENFTDSLQSPPAEFRGMPFWAWNAKLEPAELQRQIRTMHEMGLGGFFMHSRVGLATPYLGRKWFECIQASIDEARKLGMQANLYDEDRWPSGAGGGFVTSDIRWRMRYLEYEFVDDAHPATHQGTTLGWFAVERDGDDVHSYTTLADPETSDAPHKLRIFSRISECSSWYNDTTYLDTMNPDAVKAFIQSTHELYAQQVGTEFGKTIPCFFSDEPNYLDRIARNRRPWTDRLMEYYQAEYGEDLAPALPELFFSCGKKFSTARYRYYRLVTRLFVESFAKPIGEWCRLHHLDFTGHVLREDTLSTQVLSAGAAMPFYEYMQIPGMDLLTDRWLVFNTAKQVSSVARQLGKKRVLSETYGCTGWDFPLAGHKALGDWQYALGVNFRCQHLYWYSMRAEAKRDYPASIGGQSPWYHIYSAIENYFARLGWLLSNSEARISLLVLHPIESMWGRAGIYNQHLFDPDYDRKFDSLANRLLSAHLDFDFGDESLLARHGSIHAPYFCVGQVKYRELLIPELDTLRSSTVKLLAAFTDAGGMVSYLGAMPERLDGAPDRIGQLKQLYQRFRKLGENEWLAVLGTELREFSLADRQGSEIPALLSRVGNGENETTLFATNLGCVPDDPMQAPALAERTLAFSGVRMSFPGEPGLHLYEFDPADGSWTVIEYEYAEGRYHWQADFAPLQSHCYILTEAIQAAARAVEPRRAGALSPLSPAGYQLSEPNLLILDHADCIADGKSFARDTYILTLDDLLRKKLGAQPRGGAMVQPWKQEQRTDQPNTAIRLVYRFTCAVPPRSGIELVVENPELYKITLNNIPQPNQAHGWWCDPALELVTLNPADLKYGVNELTLDCLYHAGLPGLESIYLRGGFGVSAQDALVGLPENLCCSDLGLQGLRYFAGNCAYCFEFTVPKAGDGLLQIGRWQGTALGIAVDSEPEKVLIAPPYEQRIRFSAAGKHLLHITVYGHRRNAFGPFYAPPPMGWVGPSEFKLYQHPDKEFVPFGLLQLPVLRTLD